MRFEGEGCTISQAAASILADRMNKTHPTLDEVVDFPYEQMVDMLGKEMVGFRERCAIARPRDSQDGGQADPVASALAGGGHGPTSEIRALSARCSRREATAGLVFGQAAAEQRGVGGAER